MSRNTDLLASSAMRDGIPLTRGGHIAKPSKVPPPIGGARQRGKRGGHGDRGDDDELITSPRLREILGGCSQMHVWRLLKDERYSALKFPKPITINRRNFWRLRDVRRWIAKQAKGA
jgi:predicted DNA-binding transcriptional regulator AlpA